MSRALYQDIELSPEQVDRVRQYIEDVDFHLPGATSRDFKIASKARYLGYMFQQEDLEAYGVGLQCTVSGREDERTFIRISRGQLLGVPGTQPLAVNEPVLAREALTLNRFYEKTERPLRHGEETYSLDEGLPGANMDLDLLEQQLRDIVAFHNGEPVYGNQEILDLRVYWGTLLAGRYPRLCVLSEQLNELQRKRLDNFAADAESYATVLEDLGLATLSDLERPKREDG